MEIVQATETQIILKTHLIKKYFYLYENWLAIILFIPFIWACMLVEYISDANVQFPIELFLLFGGSVVVILVIRYRNIPLVAEYNFDKSTATLLVITRIVNWSTSKAFTLKNINNLELSRKNRRSILGLKRKDGIIWLGKSSYETAEKLSGFLNLPLHFEIDEEQIIQLPTRNTLQKPDTFALNCSRCGGQLPLISSPDKQIKCEFCGTVSRIEWK